MKKNLQFRGLFIALFAMMWSFALQAQTWTAPTLTGSTLTTGTTYYVYNVGSNGYLTRGGTYLTQAVVTAQPRLNASTSIIKWTATNTGGSIWTFQYNLAAANVASNFLFPSNASSADGSVYTDNTTNDTWNVVQTDAPNKIYSIQVVSGYGGYSATQYVGSAAAAEVNNATSGGASGTSNVIRYNRTASTYTQWKFVAQTDLDLYNAKILLDRYMTYAKNRGIDISSYITTYNAGVTANITTAASTLLTALSRTTISFTNSSFESATAAAQTSMTGWTSSGGFQTQNSSPSTGFTKGGTYFVEKYIASAYGTSGSGTKAYLAAGTVTQSVSSLSSGLYELVVAGHAVQQAGANPLHTGAFITAGALSTEVCAGQDYSIENINVTGTSLTVGYSLAGTITCNWTAFDNYRLYYYGAIVPNIAVSKTSFDLSALPYSTTFDIVGGYLSADITLTPPNHITLSGTNVVNNGDGTFKILAANANITNTVTATWDGTVSVATSNIVMASGAASKNIAVSATIVPSILASKTNLSYSTSTNTGTFDITGANITSDITISVPTGITLSGTYVTGSAPTYTIVLANANAVNTVTTTWGKANNIASGTITVASSGATSKTVAITTTSDVETSTLSNIALSTGILNPVFATGTTSYSVKVPANVSSVTVTGTASSSVASISNNATAISNGTPSVVLGCSSYNTLNTTNYTVNWGGNYTFADWAANGSTDAILSLPSVYGWSATPAIGWIAANGSTAGTCRYFDYVNGVNGTNPTYTYSGSNYTGRAMLMRWDGTGNAARVYSYPVKLETCKTYSLTGKANWHGTATVPTLTYRINSANDNTGTTYATGTAVTTTVGTFIDAGISTITVPTTGVYYLTITSSTQALCAIADLSLTTNVSESLTSSQTSLSFDTNNTSRTFTITGNSLTNDVTLSAPTGITLDKTSISAADAQCGVTVTATYDKSATIRGGSITATSGILTQNITVNASADNLCYTPLYSSRTNIISDTYFNSLSAYSLSWGNAALTTDPSLVYCGLNSAVITGTNAGSFAYPLTGKWAVNTTYRVKAKVNVTSGTFQLSISGWFGAAADIVNTIPTTSGWQDVDFTFATGSVINSANQLVYFNNFGLGAGIGYIDNLEMYAIPSTSISTTNLSFDLSNTSRTFTVTGVELTSDVTLTPPTGIALDKTTIAFADANSGAQTVTATWDQTHTVTAQNIVISSTGVPTNNISVTSADLTVSTLSNIAISSGLISPAFSSGTTTYTVKVPADVSSTTVTGTATSSAASISNNGTAISTGTPSVILGCTSHDNSSTTNYTVNFANYTFTDWAANGDQTSTSASLPSTYGWKCTNIGSPNTVVNTWNNYGTQGSCRYNDVAGAYTYNSVSFTARKLWIRWDGVGGNNSTSVYSYPVYLQACALNSFTGKAAWNSVSTAPVLTFRINTASDNTGTTYGTGTVTTGATGVLSALSISNVTVPTSGIYYLNITSSTASMCAVADLAHSVNSTQSLAVSKTYAFFDNSTDGLTETFTVQGNSLVSDIALTTPTGITLSGSNVAGTAPNYTITAANAQCGVTVTATYDNLESISAGTITVANNEFSKTITIDAVKNNVIGSWDANGSVDATASIPTASGWSSTGTVNWVAANLATVGSIRYIDAPASYTYSTLPYLGRILYLRWDGNNNLGVAGVFALPVTLEACKSYTFKGKGAWNSNGSAGTITVGVNSLSNNTGTSYGTGSIVTGAMGVLNNGTFTFSVPAAGTYYLTFTSTVASLNAVADLSITENTVESMSVSTSSLFFDGLHLTKTFTVTGNTLANDISLSAPTGINLDKTTITKADAQCGVVVTATSDNTTAINSGSITITSGAFSSPISVIASADNAYTPLYNDHTNLIPDPLLNSLTGFTNSWGAKSIATGSEAYSGYGSAKLVGVNGASLTTQTITWTPSTKYRIRAMVKTTGNFQFGIQNSYAGTAANATYEIVIPSTNDTWKQVDYVFTTGVGATSGFVYFNMQGRGGTLGYIDNWELYNISDANSEADFAVKAGGQIIDQDITTTTFTVAPAATLTVNATRTLTASTLNLHSDNSGTATFLNNGTEVITTANVQQYLTSGRNWYISSPVTSATSNTFNAASNILYSYNEATAAWPQITNNETTLDVMKGYVANVATNGAFTFTGTLNNGAQQIGLTRHVGVVKEGFNLVGNPYPSYLNFEAALASASTANVSQTIWLRSKNAGNTAYVFDTYNAMTQIGTSNNNNSLIGVTAEIPPMQAFWVRVADGQTSGTLALDNTMRSHLDQSVPTNRFKSPSQVDLTQQILRLQVSNGINSDEAIVLFNSGASNAYDIYDSPKMFNNTAAVPEIFTLAGSEDVVINGMNSIQYDTEIPVGFTTGQSNTFTIKASQFSNFTSGTQIVLRDKLLNTEQDLTVANYSFTSDIITTISRFSLIFRAPSVATGINTGRNNSLWISTNANNQIVINGSANSETTVAVYNAVGQRLVAEKLTTNTKVLNTQFVSGIYMVTVTNAGKSVTTRLIIK